MECNKCDRKREDALWCDAHREGIETKCRMFTPIIPNRKTVGELVKILQTHRQDAPIRLCTDEDEREYSIFVIEDNGDVEISNFG